MVARAGIMGVMCSKDIVCEDGIEEEKGERDGIMGEERIEDIEGTESDTKIVTKLGRRDGEIETIMESTKIGEERVDEAGGWEEVKEKEARRTGEERGGSSMESSAWPWLDSDKSTASSTLTCGNTELVFNLISLLSLLRERLSLRRSDCYCT